MGRGEREGYEQGRGKGPAGEEVNYVQSVVGLGGGKSVYRKSKFAFNPALP
jgi:hypothetical protein